MQTAPRLDEIDRDLPTKPSEPERRRVSLLLAFSALIVGFVLAQLAGKLAGDVARTMTHAAPNSLTVGVVVPSMLASELALLLVALIVPLAAALPLRETLGLQPASVPLLFAAALGTVTLGPLGDQLMTWFSDHFPSLTLGIVPTLHDLAQRLDPVWLWPTFALLPGLSEELLFRGVLQRAVRRRWLAIVLSGTMFALFHVDPVHVIGVLPLGLFLAWVASRSNTTVTIVAHVLNNSLALVAIQNAELDVGFGSDHALPLSWLLVSFGLFGVAAAAVLRLTTPPSAAMP